MDLVSHNCEESLSEPRYLGSCLIGKDHCDGGDGTGESGGTGDTDGDATGDTGDETTGDDSPFVAPADLVACIGDTCEIRQALIDQVLTADSSTFAADGTYLIPHTATSDQQDGWEVAGVVSGNLGHALGFENGDVITEVAGEPVDSWAAVVDVANEALHAQRVELVLVRDNVVHTRSYVRR
ncbi:hypothetical protein [Enhygromyxa salina]|uniref:hypothetical protein n=1 Tax=Enhygromyxa salina TaxID=215803 RepID=UPI000D029442|nr:hypothetical protein [Enhygromyxa salina]